MDTTQTPQSIPIPISQARDIDHRRANTTTASISPFVAATETQLVQPSPHHTFIPNAANHKLIVTPGTGTAPTQKVAVSSAIPIDQSPPNAVNPLNPQRGSPGSMTAPIHQFIPSQNLQPIPTIRRISNPNPPSHTQFISNQDPLIDSLIYTDMSSTPTGISVPDSPQGSYSKPIAQTNPKPLGIPLTRPTLRATTSFNNFAVPNPKAEES